MNISLILINWYIQNRRKLPWRQTKDPYLIWLSEVILQQTRVEQGLEYFLRFRESFPTVSDLANAPEDQIMKFWQGLGYYSRARNLHAAAKMVRDEFDGVFPTVYEDLLRLKGVGKYTAAAVASFAYNLPYPVLDGNVYRVLARLYGIDDFIDTPAGQKIFYKVAGEILNKERPDLHNQAIMEFGALHCTPRKPKCETCPFSQMCFAFQNSTIELLPQKKGKTKVSDLYINYVVPLFNKKTVLKKREEKGIWQNLFEFPAIESSKKIEIDQVFESDQWKTFFGNQEIQILKISKEYIHLLSHKKIYAVFFVVQSETNTFNASLYREINWTNLPDFAISRLTDKFLNDIDYKLL